ncbi:MAG: DUF523 domain-containing protein [Oscillospiraceae bacterium]|nr:DUF523 domain-containing protein [Oscillospiraceae bacterium]
MKILISACLLGVACRYDGKSKQAAGIRELAERHQLIPFCPECYGGLPTPRPASERQGERVVNCLGEEVTQQYHRGAQEALRLARFFDCRYALLKERSPACGSGQIYDGSFTGTLIPGDGVAAQLLREHGITVLGESQLHLLPEE